jgi:hypothetical protein
VESAGRIGISTGFKKFFYGVGGQFSAQAATEDADDDPAEVINHIHISDVNALADAAGITSLLTLNSRRVCKEDWSFAMSIYFFISSSIEINSPGTQDNIRDRPADYLALRLLPGKDLNGPLALVSTRHAFFQSRIHQWPIRGVCSLTRKVEADLR